MNPTTLHSVEDLDVEGQTVFLRADFNVPLKDGRILETHRVDSTLPTIQHLRSRAKKIVLASHLGRPGGRKDPHWTLAPVADYLADVLKEPVALAPDVIGPAVEAMVLDTSQPPVVLLENLRFYPGEEANDPVFSKALASLATVYVNDAFGTAHRAHASTAGMARHFRRKAAGFLFKKEVDYFSKILLAPERPLVAILGGAKVSDKIGLLKNLLPKVDSLLVGGAMAYTFLLAQGTPVGRSLVEEQQRSVASELMAQAQRLGVSLLLPVDHVTGRDERDGEPTTDRIIPPDRSGFDIGPQTVSLFSGALHEAQMVLWNGPLGLFELPPYSGGTRAIARAVAECSATSVIAGGDTVAAVRQAGVADRMTHLSTGGGATLEFLEGKTLPGVQALIE